MKKNIDKNEIEKLKIEGEKLINDFSQSAFRVGEWLTRVKNAIPHGEYTPWLEKKFSLSQRSARYFIAVYERWGDAPEKINQLSHRALFALSRVSEKVENRVIDAIEEGYVPSSIDIKKWDNEEKNITQDVSENAGISDDFEFRGNLENSKIEVVKKTRHKKALADVVDEKIIEKKAPSVNTIGGADSPRLWRGIEDFGIDENPYISLGVAETNLMKKNDNVNSGNILDDMINRIDEILENATTVIESISPLDGEKKEKLSIMAEKLMELSQSISSRAIPMPEIKNKKLSDEESEKVVSHICDMIKNRSRKTIVPPVGTKKYMQWVMDAHKLAKKYDVDYAELVTIIDWVGSHSSGNFSWADVIQSPSGLYKHFSKIYNQMGTNKKNRITVDDGRDWSNSDGVFYED